MYRITVYTAHTHYMQKLALLEKNLLKFPDTLNNYNLPCCMPLF